MLLKSFLPLPKPKKKSGKPRKDYRLILSGVFYLPLIGCQWKSLPRFYGAPSTVHDRYQEWERARFFEDMWIVALLNYDKEKGLEWEWQAVDGAMTKAPLGGVGTGANPTDRGKKGTKRSILTDGKGIPLSVIVDGANSHDKKLVKKTFDAIVLESPSLDDGIQNIYIYIYKGYNYPDIRQLVNNYGYTAHIRSRGEKNIKITGLRARR
jgi:putative transposase